MESTERLICLCGLGDSMEIKGYLHLEKQLQLERDQNAL